MEQLANFQAVTTLNMPGDLDSSTTTIVVASLTGFPSAYPYRIRIGMELLKVTALASSLNLTVVRGDGGTTAAAHLNGSAVTVVLTKEALDSIVTIQAAGTEVGSRRVINFLAGTVTDDPTNNRVNVSSGGGVPWEDSITAPVLSNFAWINQRSATATTTSKNSIWLASPSDGSSGPLILKMAAPGTNWTVIMRAMFANLNVSLHWGGFVIRDPGSGHIQLFYQTASGFGVQDNSDPTTFNSSVVTLNNEPRGDCPWWKFVYTSGTTTWSIGPDGESWSQVVSVATSSFVTSPSEVGFFTGPNNSTYGNGILLNSWATSSP